MKGSETVYKKNVVSFFVFTNSFPLHRYSSRIQSVSRIRDRCDGLLLSASCFFTACDRRFHDHLSAMLVQSASVIRWRKSIYDGRYTPHSVPGPLYRLPFMWMDWCCPSRVRHASLRCVTSRPLPRDSPCMLSLPSTPVQGRPSTSRGPGQRTFSWTQQISRSDA